MEETWATVYAESGSTVNMRKEPDKKSVIIARVPVGEEVRVLETHVYWDKVSYGGKTGYMMTDYLLFDQEAPEEPEEEPDGETVTVKRDVLTEWANALDAWADEMGSYLNSMKAIAESIRDVLGHG